jgi:hypothetical protein
VLFQLAQVAPDGFGRHRQVGGEFEHVDLTLAAGQSQDPLLSLRRTHLTPPGLGLPVKDS